MKKHIRKIFSILCIILAISFPLTAFAHSGRTDSQGGHHDYKNKSGLGSYHYHCGGHPAHLHENGICPYAPKDYITMKDYPAVLYIGESHDIQFTINSYYNDFHYTITSSDTSILRVNSDNTVTGVGSGTANITIKTSHAEKVIEVTIKEVFANDVKISISSEKLQIDDMIKISNTITPSNTTDKKLTYASSDTSIATVSTDGTIKGISSGTVRITATTSNGISDSIYINIFEVYPEEISCEDSINLIVGDTYEPQIEIFPQEANNKEFSINCDNEELLQYSGEKLNAIKEGNTVIHVETWNGIKKDIPIKIDIIPVDNVKIKDSSQYIISNIIDKSDQILLTTEIEPTNATYQNVEWKSSDTDIVSVEDNNFIINGIGKVSLTCIAHGNISNSMEIIVIDKNFVILIISLSFIGAICIAVIIVKKKNIKVNLKN